MANLNPTAANVAPAVKGVRILNVQVGEAVVNGDVGRLDETSRKYFLADATSATNAKPNGFFLSSAATDGFAAFIEGPIALGAILTPGLTYWLSATPGKICVEADLVSGNYKTLIGIPTSNNIMPAALLASGFAIA